MVKIGRMFFLNRTSLICNHLLKCSNLFYYFNVNDMGVTQCYEIDK